MSQNKPSKSDSNLTDSASNDANQEGDASIALKDTQVRSQEKESKAVEVGGRDGPDPVRYGDWEKGGRCIDF